jgi:hypothetical protein
MQLLRFQTAFEQESQIVELGSGDAARSFTVTTMWSRKECAWFLSLYEADGTAVVENARVSPGSMLLEDIDRLDSTKPRTACLFVFGPEPYQQASLGTTIRVFYAAYSELPAAPAGDGTVFESA